MTFLVRDKQKSIRNCYTQDEYRRLLYTKAINSIVWIMEDSLEAVGYAELLELVEVIAKVNNVSYETILLNKENLRKNFGSYHGAKVS